MIFNAMSKSAVVGLCENLLKRTYTPLYLLSSFFYHSKNAFGIPILQIKKCNFKLN
jgi:hypothetical protein